MQERKRQLKKNSYQRKNHQEKLYKKNNTSFNSRESGKLNTWKKDF